VLNFEIILSRRVAKKAENINISLTAFSGSLREQIKKLSSQYYRIFSYGNNSVQQIDVDKLVDEKQLNNEN
jgi:hypothetical protein